MILDTGAVSDLLAGDRNLARLLRHADRHHLPSIVLGEYRFGLDRSRARDRIEPLLERLEKESEILSVGPDTARAYARIRNELRSSGTPIPENDVWIAALALEHGLAVASRDTHFDRIAGLKRASW